MIFALILCGGIVAILTLTVLAVALGVSRRNLNPKT